MHEDWEDILRHIHECCFPVTRAAMPRTLKAKPILVSFTPAITLACATGYLFDYGNFNSNDSEWLRCFGGIYSYLLVFFKRAEAKK